MSILSNGCLSPTATGTYSFTAQVTDQSSPAQTATRNFIGVRVSAREQQAFSFNGSLTGFGGPGGQRVARTITVGATGTSTAVGFNSSTSCSPGGSVTVEVQRLTLDGRPDGTTLTSGTTSGSLSGIALSPGLAVAIDQRYALVLSATVDTSQNNATNDYYQAGDAFADAGSGWTPLTNTDNRYDLPVRTLIQPSAPLTYLPNSRRPGQASHC